MSGQTVKNVSVFIILMPRGERMLLENETKQARGVIRKVELGAIVGAQNTRFCVWAPKRRSVEVVLEDGTDRVFGLERVPGGYFSGMAEGIGAGTLYSYRLDGEKNYPDPCSRYQPDGPHGPSQVVDADNYRWTDAEWKGPLSALGQVIYELHVGAFTREGTYDAAVRQLSGLKDLGVTLIELMPLAEFPGRWNWGYDGVCYFAPAHVYGTPDSLKHFIDAAHALNLGVILDVVYNHAGPDGNYLRAYSDDYFTDRYNTDWGEAINYDCEGVRQFFLQNAAYWISEYHFDGLRIDATQNIYDSRPIQSHILTELGLRARQVAAAAGRSILLYAESEPQDAALVRPVEQGGYGLDGVWIDDFHHTARVALTGYREAYFTDYRGEAQEFISAVKRGSLYQGQRYDWQNQPRGVPISHEPPASFVFYLQNHDQIANSLNGIRPDRASSPGRYRALTALLLLAPETPLLFMGQEFGSSRRFTFFADHVEWLASKVHAGRREFLSQFPSHASPGASAQVADPAAMPTFESCKLDSSERLTNSSAYRLHSDLLLIRREDRVIAAQSRAGLDGAVLSPSAFLLRFSVGGEDRLLIVNLGVELRYNPAPEPLLAPPTGCAWKAAWSSNDARYEGPGFTNPCTDKGWILPGESAVFFTTRVQKHVKRTC